MCWFLGGPGVIRSMTKNRRINIRPYPEDLRTLDKIAELAPQTRSDIIRNALAISCRYSQRPFLLTWGKEVHRLRIQPPPSSLEGGGQALPLIQIRKDPTLEERLRLLSEDRRFGSTVTTIIRTAVYFFFEVVWKCSFGWRCCEDVGNEVKVIPVIEELGLELRSPVSERWFTTKSSRTSSVRP